MITVDRLRSAPANALDDINVLLKQLRRDPNEPLGSESNLQTIVSDPNVLFIVVRDNARIIGMGTCYLAQKFGKRTGFVEDVVVDETYRGQGLGRKVMEGLISASKTAGASQLYLTSGHDRVAAQKLYEKLGFVRKDTNVFKMSL